GKERRPLAAARLIPENAEAQLRCRRTAPLRPSWTGPGVSRVGIRAPRILTGGRSPVSLFVKFATPARGHVRRSAPARVCLSAGLNRLIIPLRLRSSGQPENFMEFEDAT